MCQLIWMKVIFSSSVMMLPLTRSFLNPCCDPDNETQNQVIPMREMVCI